MPQEILHFLPLPNTACRKSSENHFITDVDLQLSDISRDEVVECLMQNSRALMGLKKKDGQKVVL